VALEHAAGFMLAGDRPPLAEYLARWRDRLGKLPPRAEYPTSVAATLGLSIDALRAESAPAHDVLCLFAWLGPDGIPRDALLKPGAAKLPASIATAFADADQWSNVVEALVRYALVAREPERGPVSAYRVHRLVQQVMRHRMASEGTASAWLAEACALVERAHPPLLPKHWEVFSKLLPHARAIRAAVGSGDSPPTFGPMLERVALYLQQRGLYTEARDFQASALESDLRNLGSDHPAIADRRAKLASILSDLGEDQLARTHMQAALDAELARYPPDHPTVLDRRSDLGVILRRLKEYGEARRHMEIVLEAALDRFGPDHANVAITRSNLAVILLRSELPNEARLQAQQALDSDLRRLGPDDTDVATDRSNLAMVLIELGDHEEALTQLDLALESETHTFGKAHPTVAVTRLNRAKALLAKGDYQTALDEVDRALEVFRRALPDSHPHIGTATRRREEILARIST
jgi:tetratricopeptide (TPR) repeat protein